MNEQAQRNQRIEPGKKTAELLEMALAIDEQVARNAAFVPVALGATTPARATLERVANCAARRWKRMSKPVEGVRCSQK